MVLAAQLTPARVLGAVTFTVNKTGNAADLNVGDGRCDTSASSGRQCTLRAAIQEANATVDADTINFNIGSASKIIAPSTELPPIANPLTINGYSQAGASVNTQAVGNNAVLKIVLDGINAGAGATGLRVDKATGVVIRGLVIQRWDGAGVSLAGTQGVLAGNFIGTTAGGGAARGNRVGVRVTGSSNTIGGTTASARNLISGNTEIGALLDGASKTLVAGNYIGTNKGGTADLGNGRQGVLLLNATKSTIGGSAGAAGNVISANAREGIALSSSTYTVIQGNLIGTDATGAQALGNDGDGVSLLNSDLNTIGGTTVGARNTISDNQTAVDINQSDANTVQGNRLGTRSDGTGDLGNRFGGIHLAGADNVVGGTGGAANVIANTVNAEGILIGSSFGVGNDIIGNSIVANAEEGIQVLSGPNEITGNTIVGNGSDGVRLDNFITASPTGVRISRNVMIGNGGLGIDLGSFSEGAFGVTANDPGDGDTGANNLQNFPVITSALRQPNGTTIVNVTLNSLASTEYRVELFTASSAADASNHGEALAFLADQTGTTNASGNKTFTFQVGGLVQGQLLTATAINTATGDTSEFAVNVPVVNQ